MIHRPPALFLAVVAASLLAGIYCAAAGATIQDKAGSPALSVPDVSDTDIALVRKAIDSLRTSLDSATQIETAISDPAARKLVEWIILRGGNGLRSTRYLAFIAANPSWPSVSVFRRYAEEMLWIEDPKPSEVLRLFERSAPQTVWGRLALAGALAAQGDTEGANTQVRNAWHNDWMSADREQQVLKTNAELLTRADHTMRLERRVGAGDKEGAMRAAHRLWTGQGAIARARIALARVQVLRRQDKVAEAAQALLSAAFDADAILDREEWWVERRILSRKLLDIGDVHSAYRVVRDADEPVKENSRVERFFMAGWIALQYLQDPDAAAGYFARIQDVSTHPTSLARSHYWLGRTAEALDQPAEACTEYEAAARSPATYYGQLAHARLRLGALALASPVPPADGDGERPEPVRALDILYALNERSLAISFMTDAGDDLDDVGMLRALGDLAEQRQDARALLHLGKAALRRGLPLEYYAFPTVGVPPYTPIGTRIDPALVFAIIRQESRFDPTALSNAHAMGLMQVTPTAGRDACKRFGCRYDSKRLKNDSAYNLQVGATEVEGLLEDYRGNHILAFAAYNAGRSRVQEWIKTFGDPRDPKVDPVDWVERIPIMETRNYVQRVMENMQIYRALLSSNAPPTDNTRQ